MPTLPPEAWQWGPGLVVLILGFFLLWQSLPLIKLFIQAQQRQADAMSQMANCIETSQGRDNLDHQRITLDIQVLARDQDDLRELVKRSITVGERLAERFSGLETAIYAAVANRTNEVEDHGGR